MMTQAVPFTDVSRSKAKWYLSKFTNTYGSQFGNIMADYAALWQLIDHYDCKSVAEIGTWEGYASLFMWLHPNVERSVAVDICCDFGDGYHQGLARENYGRYFRYTTPAQLVICNSNEWTATKEFDLVFVDGAHSQEQATRDLETAKRAAKKIVCFHDWHNGNQGVDRMIEAAPDAFKLVDGTSVAFVEL